MWVFWIIIPVRLLQDYLKIGIIWGLYNKKQLKTINHSFLCSFHCCFLTFVTFGRGVLIRLSGWYKHGFEKLFPACVSELKPCETWLKGRLNNTYYGRPCPRRRTGLEAETFGLFTFYLFCDASSRKLVTVSVWMTSFRLSVVVRLSGVRACLSRMPPANQVRRRPAASLREEEAFVICDTSKACVCVCVIILHFWMEKCSSGVEYVQREVMGSLSSCLHWRWSPACSTIFLFKSSS